MHGKKREHGQASRDFDLGRARYVLTPSRIAHLLRAIMACNTLPCSFTQMGLPPQMANHASTRTTQLYDRRREELSLDEVERIRV